MEAAEQFAENLAEQLERHGWTPEYFGRVVGATETEVEEWLCGRHVTLGVAEDAARALGCSIEWLIFG